jgi:hypothetical protein
MGSKGVSSNKVDPEPSAVANSVFVSEARCSSLGTGLSSAGSCWVSFTGGVSEGFLLVCFFFKEGGRGFLVLLRVLDALLDPVLHASGARATASGLPGQETPSKSLACRLSDRDSVDLEGGTDSVDFLRVLTLHS